MFCNFFVLCQMSKYFAKCFGPSTRAPKFFTQMPQLFIIKIFFAIKVNSIWGAGRDTRNLCHKFHSQGPALRILVLMVANSKSQGRKSKVPVIQFQGSVSQIPSSLIPESGVSGSQVSGLNFRLCLFYINTNTYRWTLGSDDLTDFKCFIVIFFLKKEAILFLFSYNLYF